MEHTNGTVKKKTEKYTEKDIQSALNAIKIDGMSLRDAEKTFGVPKSTLNRRNNGGNSREFSHTTLSKTTEDILVQLIGHLEDIGYGITKKMFLDLVSLYLNNSNQTNLFKKGAPHPNYYQKFMKRHRNELKTMKAQNLCENRAKSATKEVFDEWFVKVGKIFDEHGFHEKPSYIYNCDETGFQPEQNEIRIITKTTTRNPFKLASNNPKTTYTV